MSWDNKDTEARRLEFVRMAQEAGLPFSELCRRFGVSRKTGYKWAARHRAGEGLADRPRKRARRSNQSPEETELQVALLRREHPTWGARKIARLLREGGELGAGPPSPSSVGRILRRRGLVEPEASLRAAPWTRFERGSPNELWQVDFKGHFQTMDGRRCHPLVVVDDHSRFCLRLDACADETAATVKASLVAAFRTHGLPAAILCDNGGPWAGMSELAVWLLRLGVAVLHGRPYHPQTQGKLERFNLTLKRDLLDRADWTGLPQAQGRFDAFRELYNRVRPHEALGQETPASR
mgnify:CR=1 FL=1